MSRRHYAAGAALGACLVVGLLSSHEVRAVAAALVNVTNTAANPVPVRATDPLNTFVTRVFPNASSDASIPVPAGKYLVITSITGFTNSPYALDVEAGGQSNGTGFAQRYPFHRPNAGYSFLENVNTQMVFDPGSTLYFSVNSSQPSNDFGGYNIDVKGYYVNAN